MGLLNLWSTSVSWNGAWLVTKPWPWQGHEGAASDNGVEVDLRWPCILCIPLWYTTIQYDSNNMTDMTEWLYDFFTSSPLTFLHIFTPTVSSPKCVRNAVQIAYTEEHWVLSPILLAISCAQTNVEFEVLQPPFRLQPCYLSSFRVASNLGVIWFFGLGQLNKKNIINSLPVPKVGQETNKRLLWVLWVC